MMLPHFLSSSFPLEKHYFMVPKFALGLIGFNPEQERTWPVRVWSLFNLFVLTYGSYAEAHYGIHQIPIDPALALDALCPVASSILSLLKLLSLLYYQKEFKYLIQRVRQLTEEQQSERKLSYQKRYYTLATRLTSLLLFCGISTSTLYTVRSLLDNMQRRANGKDWIYETPFKMIFPDVLLRLPLYPFIYVLVHWHGYITVVGFVGADGIFLGFCLYLTVLLHSLRVDICDLLAVKENDREPTQQKEKRIVRELVKLIDRHNEVADLTMRLSSIMVEITLGHFVACSLIIGTCVVDMLVFSGVGIIIYVIHTSAVGTELFLYCLGGTFLMEASSDLATRAFGAEWYGHSVHVQKMTLLMIVRAQREIIIKIPFFSPSLETLTSILRFTGSLIALVMSII